jgi:hypothetical protein
MVTGMTSNSDAIKAQIAELRAIIRSRKSVIKRRESAIRFARRDIDVATIEIRNAEHTIKALTKPGGV